MASAEEKLQNSGFDDQFEQALTSEDAAETTGDVLAFNDDDNLEDMYLTFGVDVEEYGVGIVYVTEIVGMQKIMEVPDVPHFIRGVINLRGKVIPVMDVRARFGMKEEAYNERTVIVVLEVEGIPIGLIVDRVSDVLEISESEIDAPPKYGKNKDGEGVIKGLGKKGDKVAILLEVHTLTSDEELHIDRIRAGIAAAESASE